MFKKEKYYGEVWFVNQEDLKCFCILSLKEGKVLLETNLNSKNPVYKHTIILGTFTGLGYITFIDCKIIYNESGISEASIYSPKYTFISSYHFISITNLKIKTFQISNDGIVDWVRKTHWYDYNEDKLIKQKDVRQNFRIDELGLSIELVQSTSINTGYKEFTLRNNGYLNFESDDEITIVDAIGYYKTFQKLLQFITAKTKQFSFFSFECLSCGEWANIYYQEDRFEKSGSSYIHLTYNEISEELFTIVHNAYTSKSFRFCLDKLMENLLGVKLSHSRRFINSVATFEAYNKLYSSEQKNNKLINYLRANKEYIMRMSKIEDNHFENFSAKIIRSRDYHVHSNINNENVFSDFELLYISFLLDYTVGLGLLKSMNVSIQILDKIVIKGQSVFIDLQDTNKILNKDSLFNE